MGHTNQQSFSMFWSFFAMEYYLGILNRNYQIFVTPTTVAGAFVNGIVAAPPGLQNYWFVPSIYGREDLIERYKDISPYSDNFKEQSPFFNFQYLKADIENVWYDPTRKWGMGTVAHSGKLNIRLASGRKREFILLGLQQGREILQYLGMGQNNSSMSNDFSQVHALLKRVYEQPQNLEIWMELIELFHAQGEIAQEYYCRAYIQALKPYGHNGL